MTQCIFCNIIAKTAPAEILYEDEQAVVISNINPLTPVHMLILPRKHIDSLNEIDESDDALLGHLLVVAKSMAKQAGIAEKGYRVAINTGAGGGQTIFHLHVHLLGGKPVGEGLLAMGLK
jgi:histidine triad (HIT) family protein